MSVSRLLSLVLVALFVVPVSTQLRPQPVGELPGEVSLQLMLRKLASIGTFMQTDAHPDDEDNGLLAMLGHGQGMRTVLVTATRGERGKAGNPPVCAPAQLAGCREAELREAVRLKPGQPDWLVNLAVMLLQQRQSAEAKKYAEQALRLDPGNARARVVLNSPGAAVPVAQP